MLTVIFLADNAAVALDAIVRVIYRRLTSHRLLVEWETAADAHRRARSRQWQFILSRLWIPATCLLLFVGAASWGTATMVAAAPFLLLGAFFPVAVMVIDRPAKSWRGGILTAEDRRFLRTAARRTWRYFDDFVGPQTSWLPPDNVQETPKREIFPRTSPTNIGLWLLATVAANDFGYLTADQAIERGLATFETLLRLERHLGHILNWYDVQTLKPLNPRYVSTVDSGNLLACLWTLGRAYEDVVSRPILGPAALHGLEDTLDLVQAAQLRDGTGRATRESVSALSDLTAKLADLFADAPDSLVDIVR